MLRLATDWQDYAEQMLAVCNAEADARVAERAMRSYVARPEFRPPTRFERRGERLGHGVWDLAYSEAPCDADIDSAVSRQRKLPRMPSMMNCTASAARMTPERRLMTLAPVTPEHAHEPGRRQHQHPADDQHQSDHGQEAGEQQRIAAHLAGGQQDGRERTRTGDERKCQRKHRNVLALLRLLPLRRGRAGAGRCARTPYPAEIRNNSVPPAIRNELSEIPMMSRNRAPTNANSTQMMSAISACLAGHCCL